MNAFKIALIAGALVLVTACETEPKLQLSPDFGNAVRHNMAVHIIDPEGSPEPVTAPDLSGDRAHRAYERMLNRPGVVGGGGGGAAMVPGGMAPGGAR